MSDHPGHPHHTAAELLAEWRGASRDAVAAHSAAKVAEMALIAAAAAEEAATDVDAAATAAQEAVERARTAATRARSAAVSAAEAASLALATAEGDKVLANHAAKEADEAEAAAMDRFHEAQDEGFPKTW
jgi:hypothetical protein